jgi:hypothetical protein
MPEVSRFFGIVIRMYFDEHLPPHFHAIYAGREVQIGIDPIQILEANSLIAPFLWLLSGRPCINGNCSIIGNGYGVINKR